MSDNGNQESDDFPNASNLAAGGSISDFRALECVPPQPGQARKLTDGDCPRRYCWWWHSLSFDFDLSIAAGCEYPHAPPSRLVRHPGRACIRSDPNSDFDGYEPREPHLREDGELDRWVNAYCEQFGAPVRTPCDPETPPPFYSDSEGRMHFQDHTQDLDVYFDEASGKIFRRMPSGEFEFLETFTDSDTGKTLHFNNGDYVPLATPDNEDIGNAEER